VSLSAEIELFDEDDNNQPVLLGSVRVGLSSVTAEIETLRRELRKRSSTSSKLIELEREET
jgi:hypothetical protein